MQYPNRNELRDLLEQLVGKDVTVSDTTDLDVALIGNSTYEFVDAGDAPKCVLGIELPLAHALGASLAMMPASRASASTPDPDLLEATREVVNVMSGQVNAQNNVHIRLIPGSDGTAPWGNRRPAAAYTIEIGDLPTGVLAFANA